MSVAATVGQSPFATRIWTDRIRGFGFQPWERSEGTEVLNASRWFELSWSAGFRFILETRTDLRVARGCVSKRKDIR
jgi:hypothetical protein